MLLKASKSIWPFLNSTFVKIHQNWLVWRILPVKKKDVILPHISVKEIFEEKKMSTFGYAPLWPNGPFFLLDRFGWYLWRENDHSPPFYPFFVKNFRNLKSNMYSLYPHKYHPNRFNRKKGTFGQSGAYPKVEIFFFFENFLYWNMR